MQMEEYEKYTLSDFLEDDSFVRWATNAEPEANVFWKEVIKSYPEKEAIMTQAVEVITAYRSQDTFTNEMGRQPVWSRIQAEISREEKPAVTRGRSIPLYMKVAAATTLLVAATAVYWFFADHRESVHTAYNEVTKVVLPDHTVVTLNGNSTLYYNDNWTDETLREVWLEGEAFFNVKHINKDTLNIREGERFLVHGRDVEIEVLGTSFNVRDQADKTDVTLITGKVKVVLTSLSEDSVADVIMLPGDYAEFANQNLIAKKKIEKPQQATAWISQDFVFTDALLRDIVKTLVQFHGYTVDVKDNKLLNLKIEGEISVSSIPELLATISATLDLNVEQRTEKHIVLSKK
ncbi:FecR domain-containing protein [Fulvivirgaceae bacterium PWU5]|uniref:FecR domain-containing protein n=1 Tax=Dawidia cretensis TaxID=2782350 RepID=A0AAP2DUU6_9BACT|nr:FecR domain-containing protein [Dawidia cretensis]MBT1707860.1 FecR domain-containing protein [Dawidia cretensis]